MVNARRFSRKSACRASLPAGLIALLLALSFTPTTAPAATCPNEAIRESQSSEAAPLGSTYLPACMAFEMISPPKKFGQEANEIGAFSADGTRARFKSKAALADTEALQSFGGDSYIATRGPSGWTLSPTSPPASAQIVSGGNTHGGPYAFAPDLAGWVLFGNTQAQEVAGEGQFFSAGLGGVFAPLSPPLAAIETSGSESIGAINGNLDPSGTSADLSATVFPSFYTSAAYLPEDPRADKADVGPTTNSYLASLDQGGNPTLQLLARDEAGKAWGGLCGSRLGNGGGLNQSAISPDGSRIFFSTRPAQEGKVGEQWKPCSTANPMRILVREETPSGPQIEELIPGEPSAPGDDIYQGASLDGTKVLLSSPRNLASSDGDASPEACGATVGASVGCDLYLYDKDLPEGERLIQASAGEDVPGEHEEGKGADVLSSIASISADGSHAYFAAQGVLSDEPNPEGDSAQLGEPNLYLYERDSAFPTGHLSFLGTLAEGDKGTLWGSGKSFANGAYPVPLLGGGPEGGGDGHVLLFISKAPLSSEDTDAGHSDVYRYDSAGTTSLQCVSCAPGGNSTPVDVFAGASQANPVSNFAEQGRWASEDGQTATFATAAPLVPGDEDAAVNPYLWKKGQLARLPGRINGETSYYKRPTVSAGGEEVGFNTTDPLLPQDGDATRDVYVVRVEGGFPNPAIPSSCDPLSEGACQGAPSKPATVPGAATAFFSGPGNQKGPAKCRKGQVRRRGNCVKRHHAKKKQRKRANHERGGGK